MELEGKLIQETTSPKILWYLEGNVGTSIGVWQRGGFAFKAWTWSFDGMTVDDHIILGPSCLAHW